MWWFLGLWLLAGCSQFCILKKYELERCGYLPTAFPAALVGNLFAWPIFGLWAFLHR